MTEIAATSATKSGPLAFVWRAGLSVLVVGLLVLYSPYFSLTDGQTAVVTRFGAPVREITSAGPYWRWPWPIEQVHLIDARMKIFNTPFTATFTRDKRNVILLTYVAWHVEN